MTFSLHRWVISWTLSIAFILQTPFVFSHLKYLPYKRGSKGHKRKAETTQDCHAASPSARPGQAKCRRATSLWSPSWQLWTLDAPWHSAAQRNLITFHYFDGKIRQTVHSRFILAPLTSRQKSTGNPPLQCTGPRARAHMPWIARRVHFRFSNKEHIHLLRAR